jgi:hypothetical protein
LGFPARILYAFLTSQYVLHTPSPFHRPWFDYSNNIGEAYKLWSSSLCSLRATSSLLGPNILLSTLFSNSTNLCSFLRVRDQISHPYKQQAKLRF